MNTYRWIGLVVFVLAALSLSADYIVARIIATQLPDVLTELAGKPVRLTNVRASLLRLEAYADDLTYGDPARPSTQFKDVTVELDGTDLLSGRISLASASCATLDLYLDRFEARQTGDETDLSAASRWIPGETRIARLNLRDDDAIVQTVSNVSWTYLSETGRRVSWQQSRDGTSLQFQVTLEDQYKFFAEQAADLTFQVGLAEAPKPMLNGHLISVKQDSGAFDTKVQLEGAGFSGDWSFSTDGLFALPTSSRLDLKYFKPDETLELSPLFGENPERQADAAAAPGIGSEDFLQRPLPQLSLPDHTLELIIAEIGIDDEKIRNLEAQVKLTAAADDQAPHISVTDLKADMPRGDLIGSIAFTAGSDWQVKLQAEIVTRSREPEMLKGFESTDWLWKSGNASLTTHGAALVDLINNASGSVDVNGVYKGRQEIPIGLNAQLDDSQGRIGADILEFAFGDSRFSGSVWIEDNRSELRMRLHAEKFDFTPLFDPVADDTASELPGIAIPDIGWWDSQLQVDARITADRVLLPGVPLHAFDLKVTRGALGDRIDLSFGSDRTGHLHAQAQTVRKGKSRDLDMNLQLNGLNAHAVALDMEAVVSGQLRLQGQGESLAALLGNLSSRFNTTIDFDKTEGELVLVGNPALMIAQQRVVGFSFSNLKITRAKTPVASGSFSYDVRPPLWTGIFDAAQVNLDEILAVLPAPAQPQQGESALLDSLDRWPAADLSLNTPSLRFLGRDLTDVALEFTSRPKDLQLQKLQFSSDFGSLQANAVLQTKDQNTRFELDGNVDGLLVSKLLKNQPLTQLENPLQGTVRVTTEGGDWTALTGNLRGALKLDSAPGISADDELKVDVAVQQQGKGFLATLHDVHLGRSDIAGNVAFDPGSAHELPKLTAKITSDYLDTRPWQKLIGEELKPEEEKLEDSAGAEADAKPDSMFELAQNSFKVLKDMLDSPMRLFGFGKKASSERVFSDEPIPVADLAKFDTDIDVALTELHTENAFAQNARLISSIDAGLIDVKLDAEVINGGSSNLHVNFESQAQPPTLTILGEVRGFHPGNDMSMASRSAFVSLTAQGESEAALAASMNGEVYAEGGQGTSDLAELGMGFLTADLLREVAGVLLPKHNQTPTMQCAVAFATATDGVVATPKAAVLQTRQANILIRAEVNLHKETIAAQFDARSRSGAGVSVGNIFSSTVQVRGTLLKPTLVPNATGIAWRSWAALATGGLSLLGEGVIKRILASADACDHVRADVSKLVCGGTTAAAKSSLVCPGG